MNKTIKIIIGFVICFFILVLANKVYAASASISAGRTTIEPGQSTTITASVSGTEAWDLRLNTNGGNLGGTTADADAVGSEVSKSVISATFSASSEGTYSVSLTGSITGSDLIKQSVSKSVTITVKKAQDTSSSGSSSTPSTNSNTKSNNTNLSNLGIKPNDFSGFQASKTSYSVSVPNSVDSIEIYASKGQSGQNISGTGNKSLHIGTNSFSVVVTAEDGTKKTYSLTVTRLGEGNEDTSNIEEEQKQEVILTSISIIDGKINEEFKSDIYEYTAEVGSTVENLEIIATANISTARIEITGDKDLQFGENIVIIKVTSEDEESQKTYKIVINKFASGVLGEFHDNTETLEGNEKNYNIGLKKVLFIITTILLAIIGMLSTVIAYLTCEKLRKANRAQ